MFVLINKKIIPELSLKLTPKVFCKTPPYLELRQKIT